MPVEEAGQVSLTRPRAATIISKCAVGACAPLVTPLTDRRCSAPTVRFGGKPPRENEWYRRPMSGNNTVGGARPSVVPRDASPKADAAAPAKEAKLTHDQAMVLAPAVSFAVDRFAPAARAALNVAGLVLPDDALKGPRAALGDVEVAAKRLHAHAGNATAKRAKAAASANGLAGKPRAEQLAALEKMSDAQLGVVRGAVRGGLVPDPHVAMGVSLETAARTRWAARGEGKEATAQAKEQFAAGKLAFSDNPDGATSAGAEELAYTSPDGQVRLHDSLARRPEAAAALIAHEGQHSLRMEKVGAKKASKASELDEETDAHVAQTAVWDELKGDAPLGAYRKDLDDTSSRFAAGSKDAVRAEVASIYAKGHVFAGREDKANEVFGALVFDKGAMGQLTVDEGKALVTAAGNMREPGEAISALQTIVGNAPEGVRAAMIDQAGQYKRIDGRGFDGGRVAEFLTGR